MERSKPKPESFDATHEKRVFNERLAKLLPGVEFEEPANLAEARRAVLEALAAHGQNAELLQAVWTTYAEAWESNLDRQAVAESLERQTALQIAAIMHKALIFKAAGNLERYAEELTVAEEYAHQAYLDVISEALCTELGQLEQDF